MPTAALLRTPSQTRAVRTREALLAAGAREFSARGYAATTTKSIADRAGVATGSFYQYFADKDALLRELAETRLSGLARDTFGAQGEVASVALPASTAKDEVPLLRERVERLLRHVVDVVIAAHREDPGLHAVLTERRHQDPAVAALWSARERELVTKIAALLTVVAHEGDRDATAFILFAMVEGAVHAHVLGHAHVSDARFRLALLRALAQIVLGRETDGPSPKKARPARKPARKPGATSPKR